MLIRKAQIAAWRSGRFGDEAGGFKPCPDRNNGLRLIAVQMELSLADGRSASAFQKKVNGLMERMKDERVLAQDRQNIVAFPEFAALFLLWMGSLGSLLPVKQLAAVPLALENLPSALWNMLARKAPFARALMLSLDKDLREVYEGVFSDAARKYGVYLVAGSAPITDDEGKGPFNISYSFGPSGKRILSQKKINLTPDEPPLGILPGDIGGVGVFEVPVGGRAARVGVEICLDSFKGNVRAAMREKGAHIAVVVSANPVKWKSVLPGKGITQEMDWLTGPFEQTQEDPVVYCINPMAVGEPFKGMRFEGMSSVMADSTKTPDKSGYLSRARFHTHEEFVFADVDFQHLFAP